MLNYYYKSSIELFLHKTTEEIIGTITIQNEFDSTFLQDRAWELQIPILKNALEGRAGSIFFEFSIPRMGKRVDSIVIINDVVFVIEFKVGEKLYYSADIEQVWDYALDLKNFHKPSHKALIVPILVATEALNSYETILTTQHNDNLLFPIKANKLGLGPVINKTLDFYSSSNKYILGEDYANGNYSPTPTIVEAAIYMYNNHSVEEITRSDAGAINLTKTTSAISEIIDRAKSDNKKVICFVTGVPGAGKTLVGLKVATSHLDNDKKESSVYLSGNGPLVKILHEALTRDKVKKMYSRGIKMTKKEAGQPVKLFIQAIHNYRDDCLAKPSAPHEHVAIFDEAQRTWTKEQTVKFMKQKKGITDFDRSEPDFLISCLDRHQDWAVVVCLVGGGQEINTGESGISEWLLAIENRYANWEVFISPNLSDSEYNAIDAISSLQTKCRVNFNKDLHLSVSMRSFRAENVSNLVKNILDLNQGKAREILSQIGEKYPIVLTRDLQKAKMWLKTKARGSERYGIVVSSQAERLKPLAIDVKSPTDPVNWFLEGKDDVRSSFYLEDVATEFDVQGLELDWACITWDGDLRYSENGWKTFSFKGNKWLNVIKPERKQYLINAYRVLLTRARQGMIIVIPEGDANDHTRKPEFYDETFNYLAGIGITVI